MIFDQGEVAVLHRKNTTYGRARFCHSLKQKQHKADCNHETSGNGFYINRFPEKNKDEANGYGNAQLVHRGNPGNIAIQQGFEIKQPGQPCRQSGKQQKMKTTRIAVVRPESIRVHFENDPGRLIVNKCRK